MCYGKVIYMMNCLDRCHFSPSVPPPPDKDTSFPWGDSSSPGSGTCPVPDLGDSQIWRPTAPQLSIQSAKLLVPTESCILVAIPKPLLYCHVTKTLLLHPAFLNCRQFCATGGIFGDISRCFWLSHLGKSCYWYQRGKSQKCC